jgi:hypothetical protein
MRDMAATETVAFRFTTPALADEVDRFAEQMQSNTRSAAINQLLVLGLKWAAEHGLYVKTGGTEQR